MLPYLDHEAADTGELTTKLLRIGFDEPCLDISAEIGKNDDTRDSSENAGDCAGDAQSACDDS